MSEITNVTVVRESNVYFNGKVSSRTIYLENKERITLGFMAAGEYEFGTAEKEIMEVLSGSMQILLPGETAWKTLTAGGVFEVAANQKFGVKVAEFADYQCSYIKQ